MLLSGVLAVVRNMNENVGEFIWLVYIMATKEKREETSMSDLLSSFFFTFVLLHFEPSQI